MKPEPESSVSAHPAPRRSTVSGARRWVETLFLAVLVGAIGWFYFWTAMPEPRGKVISADNGGYYNLLTRGFLKGQLSLDLAADPALATLKNPWDPAQRAGRGLHDASYYQGKYYLYFGVTPVLVLFLPFRWLTGTFISESLASLVFAWIGLLASIWLLRAARARYFPGTSWYWLAGGTVAVGLATMMPALLRRASIWEVPITCAYACLMLGLCALFQAWHARRRTAWLAGASAALGLAVGARPVYLLGCAALLVPLAYWAKEKGGWKASWRDRSWRTWLGAAILPAAAVGLGLALYNHARFGSLFEFGQTYQMAGSDITQTKLFSWSFLWYGFRLYVLSPAGWSPYFPFVTVINPPAAPLGHLGVENPYGILPNIPFVALALGTLALVRHEGEGDYRLKAFGASVAVVGTLTMITVMAFGGITNRYMVDFAPAFILLASLGLLTIASRVWFRGSVRVVGSAVIAGLLIYSVAFNVLVSLQHNELLRAEYPAIYQRVAHRFNRVAHAFDRLLGVTYGPIEMKVIFPRDAVGQIEPLVATGTTFRADYVYAHYLSEDQIRFGFEHTSRGSFTSAPIRIKPGTVQTLRIDLGSLYPPAAHPFYDTMPRAQARALQRTLRITVDGEVAWEKSADVYDATSRWPSIGTSGARPGFRKPFSGQILSWRKAPEALLAAPPLQYGPLRLELALPPFVTARNEPLVSTGESGRGDLIYIRYLAENRIGVGHDNWGSGGRESEGVEIDPKAVQVLEIDYGALYPKGASEVWTGPANRERVIVRLNGRIVLDEPAAYHPCDPDTVAIGTNAIGASSAEAAFSGGVVRSQRLAAPLSNR